MAGKKSTTLFMIFFLVQSFLYASDISPRTFILTPVTKVSLNDPESQVFDKFSIIYNSMLIYRMDAVEKQTKDEIIKKLLSKGCANLSNSSISFDLENMDLMKRGWTRYYPFSLDGNLYVVRIFRTDETSYQPAMDIVFEAQLNNPDVTVQVLGSINDILAGRKIEKHKMSAALPVPNM